MAAVNDVRIRGPVKVSGRASALGRALKGTRVG